MRAQTLPSWSPFCDPTDCTPPGPSAHGILQARTLEWAAMPSSRGSSQPRDRTHLSCIAGGFFSASPPGKPKVQRKESKNKLRRKENVCLKAIRAARRAQPHRARRGAQGCFEILH